MKLPIPRHRLDQAATGHAAAAAADTGAAAPQPVYRTAGVGVTPQLGCDWGCLASKAPGCLHCGTDIGCWLGCAGSAILQCCSIF